MSNNKIKSMKNILTFIKWLSTLWLAYKFISFEASMIMGITYVICMQDNLSKKNNEQQ